MTNRQGRYRIRLGKADSSLIASALDYESRVLDIARRSAGDIDFTLKMDLANVTGTVQDASGGVVADAVVTAAPSSNQVALTMALTDSEGRFRLSLPSGPFGVKALADGYTMAMQEDLRAPSDDIRLTLSPSASLIGRVLSGADDTPVPGVTVQAMSRAGLRSGPSPVISGVDGTFRIGDLAAGAYELVAGNPDWQGAPVWIDVAMADAIENVELRVSPAATLAANVSIGGAPCANGTVVLTGPTTTFGAIEAARATLPGLRPGKYTVDVSCPPGISRREVLELREGATSEEWNLDRGLQVRGRVQTERGAPVPNAQVVVSPTQPDGLSASCVTDVDGAFECGGISPGDYICSTERGSRSQQVHVDEVHGASNVILKQSDSASIHVVVQGAENPLRATWQIFAENDSQPDARYVARPEQDRLVFENLPLGTYMVYAGTRGAPGATTVQLARNDTVEHVTLPSPLRRQIEGRVVDQHGNAVVDAWVQAFASEALFEGSRSVGTPALSDDEGRFTITDLWSGEYDVNASGSSGKAGVRGVTAGGSAIVIRLQAFASLTVLIEDDEGIPTSDFELSYTRESEPTSTLHGSGGVHALRGLKPGNYTIEARSGSAATSRSLSLAPAEQSSVRMVLSTALEHQSSATAHD